MKKIITVLLVIAIALVPITVQADDTVTVKPTATEKKTEKAATCNSLFGTKTNVGKLLRDIYNVIKFAVPALLLALSIKDFGGVIVSQDADALKKATSTLFKRIVIAILILVTPTIIEFILDVFGIDRCLL